MKIIFELIIYTYIDIFFYKKINICWIRCFLVF